MHSVDPVAGGLCAACESGDACANECAYGDATGITRSDRDARAYVHCNTHAGADRNHRSTHSDAGRDVHGNTRTTTDGDRKNAHDHCSL